MFIKKLITPIIASTLLITGCATLELETNVKMTKSVFLKPHSKENKTIYISLKNITDDNLDILPLLKQKLKEKNYTLLETSDNAQYILMINVLFANNLKEANAVKAGAGLGITSGFIAAGSGSNAGNSLLIGASVALASGLVAKSLEDETYRAVVDIVIDEKSDDANSDSVMGKGYKEHKTRVLAEAVQTNLKLNEALPILSQKVATQLSNTF